MKKRLTEAGEPSSVAVREKKGKKYRSHLKWLIAVVCVVLALVCGLLILPVTFGSADRDVVIHVPKGATVDMVRDSVAKYLGDSYAGHVAMVLKMFDFGQENRHGAYRIGEGDSPLRAGRTLCRGGQTGIMLTINGQRTKEDLARRICRTLDIKEADMLAALNDPALLGKYDTDPNRVMALFLNNSYEFYWDATPEDVIERMSREYAAFWNNRRTMLAENLRLSPLSVSIVASIADEETNVADEKGRIGRLYINRLNEGMKLQADPTVRYALNDFTIRRVSLKDTRTPSPYNTYLVKGLPPGPIRTPDPATIDAILHSAESRDIYMCADTSFSGRHFFSADYDTHRRYAEAYRKALDRRGIHR